MIRYGLSGCGYFGAEIGRRIARLSGAQLLCCMSPGKTGAAFSQEMNIPHYTDYDTFLAHPNMDAVIIAGPSNTHTEQFIQAARAGKRIYIEKPFALSVEDAEKMLYTAKEYRTVFMIGHILHFYPRIRQTRTLLQQTGTDSLGAVLTIHAERTGWEEAKEQVSWKKMKAVSGGHLFHHIHELDIVQYFAGSCSTVFCAAGNLAHRGSGFGDEDDVLLLTLRHKSGVLSTMQYGSAFRLPNHFIRINCERGGILLDLQNNRYTLTVNGTHTSEPFFDEEESRSLEIYKQRGGGAGYGISGQQIPQYLANVLDAELTCFHTALTTGKIPEEFADLFDGSSAFESIKTASAAMQSAVTVQAVRL
ncbi:MAG: Gfo/Idh/MocA family oxidoreductase [Treponema sp.]